MNNSSNQLIDNAEVKGRNATGGKYSIENFKDVVLKKIPSPNCDQTLQIEPVLSEDGWAKAIWTIDEKFVNGIGVTMGGFVAAATDTMMAYAIATELKQGQSFTTIDLHTTFFRPVVPGIAEVVAKVERKGNRTAYLTAEVVQNDKKCCNSISTIMILD